MAGGPAPARKEIMENIGSWFQRQFSDPQVVALTLVLLTIGAIIFFAGEILAPLFTAIVIAYLLQSVITPLERAGLPHLAAVTIVFSTFMAVSLAIVLGLVPLLVRQLTQLFQQLPSMMGKAQELILQLHESYPGLVSQEQVTDFIVTVQTAMIGMGQKLVTYSVSSLGAVISIGIFVLLVPLMVFFMLRDKNLIVEWINGLLPRDRKLTDQVWQEVDDQIGNYLRGKVWEIFIVGAFTYLTFTLLGLQYALVLAALTGFSVLIPYVGAAVVTVPVALVAYFQWGISPSFYYALIAYAVIQALDGNVLAPLLFSEAVNLHPVAVIVAILLFGGIWGFWGVFFAIPLATVVKAVVRAWPTSPVSQAEPALVQDAVAPREHHQKEPEHEDS